MSLLSTLGFEFNDRNDLVNIKLGRVFGISFILFSCLVMICCGWDTVQPGHRGIAITMGKVDPEFRTEGFTLKLPFLNSIKQVSIQQQTMTTKASCFSIDYDLCFLWCLLSFLGAAIIIGIVFYLQIYPIIKEKNKYKNSITRIDEILEHKEFGNFTKIESDEERRLNIIELSKESKQFRANQEKLGTLSKTLNSIIHDNKIVIEEDNSVIPIIPVVYNKV